ncbi:YdeI/OmpD-associated family protein [Catalinimonas locisalis]|uniref:YdeI/OmpD-associated family protein n=1 Tax=Catalinimonas locisalis TaxID=3133978 RepID=UPI00310178E1
MNPKVDQYLIDGCMRCKYGGTPQCKVNNWKEELVLLRHIILACGLTEDLKWGVPCYTSENKNIAMVSAFKDYASLSFFKGVLLKDPRNILQQQGKSSQSARLIKFTSPEQIMQQQEILKTYILEAVDIEKSEAKVKFKQNPEPVPDELLQKFDENASLKKAFYALTPGRQRGYIIYFSQPKKTGTRFSRIEKCIPQIFNGKGMHDN